jgi:DNA-binding transcriptional ArsR family regulator
MPSDPRVRLLAELADDTRYAVLERLEEGPASAAELGELLGVAPTRLANHLRRLRDAGLVAVSHHGRIAIYQLAEPGLREIFSMVNGLRGALPRAHAQVPVGSTCYDHLAGRLGVALMDHLVQSGALQVRDGEGELQLGPAAVEVFGDLGVELPRIHPRRMLAFSCLDSRAGRPHLGGQLGAQLATSFRQRGWVEPAERPRRLRVTAAGGQALARLGIELPLLSERPERGAEFGGEQAGFFLLAFWPRTLTWGAGQASAGAGRVPAVRSRVSSARCAGYARWARQPRLDARARPGRRR